MIAALADLPTVLQGTEDGLGPRQARLVRHPNAQRWGNR
jgi:hypothetical protein